MRSPSAPPWGRFQGDQVEVLEHRNEPIPIRAPQHFAVRTYDENLLALQHRPRCYPSAGIALLVGHPSSRVSCAHRRSCQCKLLAQVPHILHQRLDRSSVVPIVPCYEVGNRICYRIFPRRAHVLISVFEVQFPHVVVGSTRPPCYRCSVYVLVYGRVKNDSIGCAGLSEFNKYRRRQPGTLSFAFAFLELKR